MHMLILGSRFAGPWIARCVFAMQPSAVAVLCFSFEKASVARGVGDSFEISPPRVCGTDRYRTILLYAKAKDVVC